MITRIITGIVGMGLAVYVINFGSWLFSLTVLALAMLAWHEFARAFGKAEQNLSYLLGMAAIVFMVGCAWQGNSDEKLQTLTESQRFGLRIAGVVSLLFIAAIALMVIPENGILRDPINHTVMPSPFIKGIVPLIILFFFVVSLAYGIATRTIRRQADLPHLMIEPMKEMAGFIVMVFPLAQFVAMFNWSNMGKFIAVGLTDILESSGLSGIPAFVGLALLSSFLCMFIASGSAIWSILAPIFVPMFMLLGFHPAFAQILFRIADSSVLPLAPVSPFVPLFLGFLQRYKPDAKLGTYYSLVLPYPLIFLVVWLLMLLAWYLVGLPIGPGIYPRLS